MKQRNNLDKDCDIDTKVYRFVHTTCKFVYCLLFETNVFELEWKAMQFTRSKKITSK